MALTLMVTNDTQSVTTMASGGAGGIDGSPHPVYVVIVMVALTLTVAVVIDEDTHTERTQFRSLPRHYATAAMTSQTTTYVVALMVMITVCVLVTIGASPSAVGGATMWCHGYCVMATNVVIIDSESRPQNDTATSGAQYVVCVCVSRLSSRCCRRHHHRHPSLLIPTCLVSPSHLHAITIYRRCTATWSLHSRSGL